MSDELVPDHSQMRASDRDREGVARVLQEAHREGKIDLNELDERLAEAYAAKTYGELAKLTADLQVPTGPTVVPTSLSRINTEPGSSLSVAFWSGVDRKGDWTLASRHNVISIMGGVELDLSHAHFSQAESTITVFAFWAGVVIYVPDDITVKVDGFGIMGAFEDNTHTTPTKIGGPIVRISGVSIMAAVEIRRPKKKKKKAHELER